MKIKYMLRKLKIKYLDSIIIIVNEYHIYMRNQIGKEE